MSYVDRFTNNQLTEEEQRVIGFPWSEDHVKRSYASTGGTVAALHDVMSGRSRVAMQLAGGTHHAFFDHGERMLLTIFARNIETRKARP